MNNEIVTKKCTGCNENKELIDFCKRKASADSLSLVCRDCASIISKQIYRTKNGLIERMYGNQKKACKRRNMSLPTYSKKEFKDWLLSQKKFHVLYDNWKRLDYQKDYIPSVDRKDDYISYTMDNIQLMTWGENKDKYNSDTKNGINNKRSKSVLKLTKFGSIIDTYFSINEASKQNNVDAGDIVKSCKGKRNLVGGFKWKYKL